MSSMDFTSFSDASETCIGIADGIYANADDSVVLIPVIGTSSSGIMAICTLYSFYFINLSISLIYALCSMIRFIKKNCGLQSQPPLWLVKLL
jgi:hypothetical protein